MTEQILAREEVPIRKNDPLWVYLDRDTKYVDPEVKELCESLQKCTCPQQAIKIAGTFSATLAADHDLPDQDDLELHELLFTQIGQALAHVVAKLNATDLLGSALARSIVESAEAESGWQADTDRPADLFHLDPCVQTGFDQGREQPFLGSEKTSEDLAREAALEAGQAERQRKEKLEAIGVPVHPADITQAEKLLAMAVERDAATSPEALRLIGSMQYGSPHVVSRFFKLAEKAHGEQFVGDWWRSAQDEKIKKLRDELEDAKGTDRKLLLILKAYGRFFRDKDNRDFVSAHQGGVLKTLRVDGGEFDDWVVGLSMEHMGLPLSKGAIDNARAAGRALASTGGEVREVFKRVATIADTTYIDLCDLEWRAVAVNQDGWEIVNNPPVCFERSKDMHPLPLPERGCSISELERYLNVGSQLDLVFCVAWMVMAQRNDKACPLLAFIGPSGTAKSTSQTTLRRLVDPNKGDLRVSPKTNSDVVVTASNNWVVSYENISKLSGDVQDVFCSIVTGGAFSTRELYTTNSEHVAQFQRPIIINGITNFITRPDLMQRAVIIEPPSISKSERRTDYEVRAEFNALRPKLLGAVLDIHVKALALLPEVQSNVEELGWGLPRMASFATMGEAVARAMGFEAGVWFSNYTDRIAEQANDVLDSSPVFIPLLTFMREKREWSGTNDKLRSLLKDYAGQDIEWFRTAKSFGDALRRIEAEAKAYGISMRRVRSNGTLKLTVTYKAKFDKSRGVTKAVHDPDSYSETASVVKLSDVRNSEKGSTKTPTRRKRQRRK